MAALVYASTMIQADLIITSACDGAHSGPNDPHHRGEAYDIRTHDFTPQVKLEALNHISQFLGDHFYAFLEDEGTANEHIHAQVKKGTNYPPIDPLTNTVSQINLDAGDN